MEEQPGPDDVVEPTALCAEYGSPHPQHVVMRVTASQAEIDRWLSYDGEGYDSHYVSGVGEEGVQDMSSTTHVNNHTDCYFNKSRESAFAVGHSPRVLYQIFQKHDATLAGIELIKPLFAQCKDTMVYSLEDGDAISPWESVMHIDAPFTEVVDIETVYLGILARCTRVATNVRKCVDAANGKPLLFFPARFDVPEVQPYDGYAARIGGAAGCSTYTQMTGFNGNATKPSGTMPHALIAAFGGDTVKACLAYAQAFPNEDLFPLVDFTNDCAAVAVECYKALKEVGRHLTGVRLDTSEKLVDKGVGHIPGAYVDCRGVCVPLVKHVRQALNEAGASDVQICVSGGFNYEKIAKFTAANAPVDVYAVGESTISGAIPFTSDIVRMTEGNITKEVSKVGRGYKVNGRMKKW